MIYISNPLAFRARAYGFFGVRMLMASFGCFLLLVVLGRVCRLVDIFRKIPANAMTYGTRTRKPEITLCGSGIPV